MKEVVVPDHPDLVSENTVLRRRIAELQGLEAEYRRTLEKLSEKEAFNFALFQYNPVLTIVVDREGRTTPLAPKIFLALISSQGTIDSM